VGVGLALAVEGGIELGEELRTVLVEGGERGSGRELEAEGRAGNEGTGGDDEESEFGAFDGALEAIPEGGGHAAEFVRGGVAEVEDDETEVGIASEEVGNA